MATTICPERRESIYLTPALLAVGARKTDAQDQLGREQFLRRRDDSRPFFFICPIRISSFRTGTLLDQHFDARLGQRGHMGRNQGHPPLAGQRLAQNRCFHSSLC